MAGYRCFKSLLLFHCVDMVYVVWDDRLLTDKYPQRLRCPLRSYREGTIRQFAAIR
jgi:hypothetical protein